MSSQLGVGLTALALLLWWWVPQHDWVALRETPLHRAALVLGTVFIGALAYGLALALVGIRPAQFYAAAD